MPRIGDLRYVWDEDSFLLSGGKSCDFYKLGWKENIPVFMEISSIESRRAQWGWRGMLTTIPELHSIDIDLFPLSLIKLAALANQLFVMYEYEVYSLNQNGEIEFTYSAPENFCFSDLDTIPANNGYPPALVLGCKSLNGSDSELLVFGL